MTDVVANSTDLTGLASLIELHAKTKAKRREVDKEAAELKATERSLEAQILRRMGDARVGTVNGNAMVAWESQNRFAFARFAEEEPELAYQFMVEKTDMVVDVELIRKMRPDIWAKYEVNTFKNYWDLGL